MSVFFRGRFVEKLGKSF
uniref:Uncharacterized protein n=1 Tax=Lepeophtheirus salmonis TaxID=72036 RepID=A0A0K2VAC4_LEPSM